MKGYGKHWDKYPLEQCELWESENAKIMCWDITNGTPNFLRVADMIYCDPPWNIGILNTFNSKANKDYTDNFSEFYIHLFNSIREIEAKVCYLEMGEKNMIIFKNELSKIYPCVQVWSVAYCGNKPSYLLRGSSSYSEFDYTGMDDMFTPHEAIKNENPKIVTDLCTGSGLTAISSFRNKCKFVGTELNKRKLAWLCSKGVKYSEHFIKSL